MAATTTTTTEDFSFPTTTNPPPRFIGSPPLWHRTSTSPSRREQPETKSPKGNEKEGRIFPTEKPIDNKQRKSFSYFERGPNRAKGDESGGEEEKMDILWEEFNEELLKIQGSKMEYSEFSPGRGAELGCVKGLKLSKNGGGGAVFSGEKVGVVVLMKVLKRLFSLHNSQRKVKKRTW